MINIMIQISAYIFIAILLGCFFGWLITKTVLNKNIEIEDKRLHSKDEVISALTTKLTSVEDKQMKIEKKYEEEIDAFMFERIEITQKYKNLLEKINKSTKDIGEA